MTPGGSFVAPGPTTVGSFRGHSPDTGAKCLLLRPRVSPDVRTGFLRAVPTEGPRPPVLYYLPGQGGGWVPFRDGSGTFDLSETLLTGCGSEVLVFGGRPVRDAVTGVDPEDLRRGFLSRLLGRRLHPLPSGPGRSRGGRPRCFRTVIFQGLTTSG